MLKIQIEGPPVDQAITARILIAYYDNHMGKKVKWVDQKNKEEAEKLELDVLVITNGAQDNVFS